MAVELLDTLGAIIRRINHVTTTQKTRAVLPQKQHESFDGFCFLRGPVFICYIWFLIKYKSTNNNQGNNMAGSGGNGGVAPDRRRVPVPQPAQESLQDQVVGQWNIPRNLDGTFKKA